MKSNSHSEIILPFGKSNFLHSSKDSLMNTFSKLLAAITIIAFFSCTKSDITEPQTAEPTGQSLFDWASGQEIITIGDQNNAVSDRSQEYYVNCMNGATTKYSAQARLYIGNTLVSTGSLYWLEANSSVAYQMVGDNTNEYNMRMTYGRKLPGTPCTLTIYWTSNCGGQSAPETFTIGPTGTIKTYFFPACN